MFGTIRKHQTWLWAVIITITIISFVIFFGPQSRFNTSGRETSVYYGSINGQPVNKERYDQARKEVFLRYFFQNNGTWPGEEAKKTGWDETRETYTRLLLVQKQEQLGIHVSSEMIAQFAQNILRSRERNGINSPEDFVKKLLEPNGFGMEDLERFLRHELGIQEMASVIGLSGKLVTPEEIKSLYVREHQEVATEGLLFSASNYLARVQATPEAISEFWSNRMALYRIPERVQVSYVKFDLTNFVAEADQQMAKMTNLEDRIEAVYQQRGTNYYKEAKSPEDAKAKIRGEARKEFMATAARARANAFATELFNRELRPESLATLATESNLTVRVSAPFDLETGPKDLDVGPSFAKTAFSLSPTNEPFAGPLAGEDAIYVIAYNKRIPSEVPTLDQVRERVVADYKYGQALNQARQAGQAFYQTLTNGLAQGKTFSALCAEAKFKPLEVPPFSLSTRSLPDIEEQVSLNLLQQLAFSSPPGTVGYFQPGTSADLIFNVHGVRPVRPNAFGAPRTASDGGVILYVRAMLPIDETKMQTELAAFTNAVRQGRQNDAFQAWFRKEADRGLRDTPVFKAQQPPPTISSATGKS
jgi:hypothetical protein